MEKGEQEGLFEEVDFSEFTKIFSDLGTKEETQEESTEESTEEQQNSEEETEDTEQNTEENSEENSEEGSQEAEENSEEDTTSTDDIENSEENSSPFTPYAKLLVDEGILPNLNLEEFDGTGEGLMKAMDDQISSGVESYKEQLPTEIKTFLENYEEGIPLSTLLETDSRRAEYKAIPTDKVETDKDLQKSLVRELYKQTTRFSEEKITKLIQQADDLDELKEEAKSAHKDLIVLQDEIDEDARVEAKEQRDLDKKDREAELSKFKKTLENTQEVIPGIKINPNSKKRIEALLGTSVAQDSHGNSLNEIGKYRAEHPYEFDIMLAHLYDSTKGFKDWSVLGTVGKKSAFKDLENASKRLDSTKGNKPKATDKKTTNAKDIVSGLKSSFGIQ